MFQKFCFYVSLYLQKHPIISLLQQGVARIHVIDAEKLPDEDWYFFGEKSDPYVIVTGAKEITV